MELGLEICLHRLIGRLDRMFLSASDFFASLLFLLVVMGIMRAFFFAVLNLVKARKLRAALDRNSKSVSINSLTGRTDNGVVFVIDENSNYMAFNLGFLNPRIYLSSALVRDFDSSQLDIVIQHEKAHKTRKDPLKKFLLAIFKDIFWFIPLSLVFVVKFNVKAEIECDRQASINGHDPVEIAKTLLAVASHEDKHSRNFVPVGSSIKDFLETRIRILSGEKRIYEQRLPIRALVISLLVLIVTLTSGIGFVYGNIDPFDIHARVVSISESCESGHADNAEHKIFGLTCPPCSHDEGHNGTSSCDH